MQRHAGHFALALKLKKHLHELLGWRGPMTRRQFAAWAMFLNPDAAKAGQEKPFDPYFSKAAIAEREAKLLDEHPELNKDGRVTVRIKRKDSTGDDARELLLKGISRQDEHGKKLRRDMGIAEPPPPDPNRRQA